MPMKARRRSAEPRLNRLRPWKVRRAALALRHSFVCCRSCPTAIARQPAIEAKLAGLLLLDGYPSGDHAGRSSDAA